MEELFNRLEYKIGVLMIAVIEVFQKYPFLQTEWFYAALSFLLALSSAVFGIALWRKDAKQKLNEEKQHPNHRHLI